MLIEKGEMMKKTEWKKYQNGFGDASGEERVREAVRTKVRFGVRPA